MLLNPLLLATPLYGLLLFLSQRPGAPEQDRWRRLSA